MTTANSSAEPDQTPPDIRLALGSAILGAVASLGAIVAFWWARAGETPVFIFARFETLRTWRTADVYWGLPIEFWTLACFTCVIGLTVYARTRLPLVWQASVLICAIGLISIVGALAWQTRGVNWPLNVMTLAATGLLASASMTVGRRSPAGPHRLSKVGLTMFLATIAVTAVGGHLMRQRFEQVSGRAAAESNFLRWFHDARSLSPRPSADVVMVEIFNDYQCPFCAGAVPKLKAAVEGYRLNAGRNIKLVLRDFPLDPACNPGLRSGPHLAACEAAAFARFCEDALPSEESASALRWLYAQGRQLTADQIRSYVNQRGLANQFEQARAHLAKAVVADTVDGLRRGVRATPAVIVDGVLLPNHVYLETALRSLAPVAR
jgi:protein-disulfide isomerase